MKRFLYLKKDIADLESKTPNCCFFAAFLARCLLKKKRRRILKTRPTLVISVIVHMDGDGRGIWEQLEKWTHEAQSRAISFSGEVQEEDVNPASTAFTTMISQQLHPPLPAHQLDKDTSPWMKAGKTRMRTLSLNIHFTHKHMFSWQPVSGASRSVKVAACYVK